MHRKRLCSTLLGLSLATAVAAAPVDFVPAQTPYLLTRVQVAGSGELDRNLTLLLLPWLADVMRGSYCDVLSCTDLSLGADPGAPMPPAMKKLLDELIKLARPEQWRVLGLALDGEVALYGIGALPVLRIELSDEAAFSSFVEALGAANGSPLRQLELPDGTAWILGTPGMDEGESATQAVIPALILATQDGAMVASFIAEAASDEEIRAQLARPSRALGASGAKALAQKYGLDGRLTAMLDLRQLGQVLLSPKDAADRQFRAAHGMAGPVLEPLCASEALSIVARVPKVVFGLARSSATHLDARWIVELEPALAGELSRAARRGPQLNDQGHAVDVSMAVDVARFLTSLRTRAEQGLAAPFLCPQFAQANQSMQELLDWTLETAASPWNGLLSARVEIPAVQRFVFEGTAGSVEARDPLALSRTFNWLFSSLDQVKLSADGQSFVLQDGSGHNRVLANLSPTRVNVAAGDSAEQRLLDIASAAEVPEAAALSLRIGTPLIRDSGWFSEADRKQMGPLVERLLGVLLETRLTTRGVESLLRLELDSN